MNLRIVGIVVLTGLIAAAAGTAQLAPRAKPSPNVLMDMGYATAQTNRLLGEGGLPHQLYEEIEIMRRLLERSLAPPMPSFPGMPTPGGGGAMMSAMGMGGGMPMGMGTVGPTLMGGWDVTTGSTVRIQGFYLKGHGVVFSLSLPVTGRKVVGESSKPSPPALTDWERVRKELRGEKPEAPTRRQPEDNPLSDAILKVLGQNGHHFTQLGEGDQLTVAVTFFRPTGEMGMGPGPGGYGIDYPSPEGGTGAMSGPMGPIMGAMMGPSAGSGMSPMGGMMSPPGSSTPAGPGGGFPGMGAPGPGSTGTSLGGRTSPGGFSSSGSAGAGGMADDPAAGFMGEGRKHSLLGDLHMKQAQFQQARDMYAKAVDTCKKALEKRGTTGYRSADLLVELELVEHLTKLGQAYQGQGQNEQARKILQEITQITQRTSGAAQTGSKPPAGTTPKPLPNRLIISVSKKLLGEVGKGKMGVDEFRKNATVQYLDFSKPVSEKAIIEDSLTKPPAKP